MTYIWTNNNISKIIIIAMLSLFFSCGQHRLQQANRPIIEDYSIGEKWTWKYKGMSSEGEVRSEGLDIKEIIDQKGTLGMTVGNDTILVSDILKPHQQDRISIWLRLEKDPEIVNRMKRDIAYNLNESEKAISSGDLFGRGFMQGTRTTGKFVPEQHTDYIFSTVGEEWGFIGSALTVIVFCALLLRIIYLSELQKSQFSRVYGYSVASILFTHFTINIGMVMGLIPTIGIPLPFFSYGGSGLWAFTILLFVFIKLDANKVNEW